MLLRNRFVLPFVGLVTIAAAIGCGSGSNGFTNGNPPPTGGFAASNLNGTYVFSISGTDSLGAPMAIAGTFTADGKNGIKGGAVDINNPDFTQVTFPNLSVGGNSSYRVGQDGRGQATLVISGNPYSSNIIFDFVLQDSSHGLISEFDANATGSGTLDLQSSGVSPNGTYAFSFAGASVNGTTAAPWAMVGNFTVGTGGAVQGLEDYNLNGGASSPGLTLGGNVTLGPSSTPATTLTTSAPTSQTYDVIAISASHLKFIEMDSSGTLVGDAFSQGSATIPATSTTYAFVLEGAYPVSAGISAAGGFMVTDGTSGITNASTIDANNGGSGVASAAAPFSGSYAPAGGGRYTLSQLSGFEGTGYVAYTSSVGLLLLETDDLGIMSGVAYPRTSTSFASGQGYAFNLTGANLASGNEVEVDDIAEFTANSSGLAITGFLDENYEPGGGVNPGLPFKSGTYTAPDSNGRGQISSNVGSGNNTTLNGGFSLSFYTVDGTTFPFIETDGNGQSAAGVFVEQNASASASASARSHLFVARPAPKAAVFHRRSQ